jgi:hypothetical protein
MPKMHEALASLPRSIKKEVSNAQNIRKMVEYLGK